MTQVDDLDYNNMKSTTEVDHVGNDLNRSGKVSRDLRFCSK